MTPEGRARRRRLMKIRGLNKKPPPTPVEFARPTPATPCFFGYVRVSTKDQADNGTSLAEQEEQVRKMWSMSFEKTHHFASVYRDEAVSGSTRIAERPGGGCLMASLKKGDVVAFSKLDRAFRSISDGVDTMAKLDKAGVTVVIMNMPGGGGVAAPVNYSTPIGRLILQQLMAFAEFERAMIAERTLTARNKVKHKCRSHPPYGLMLPRRGAWNWVVDVEHRSYVSKIMEIAETEKINISSWDMQEIIRQRGLKWYAGSAAVRCRHYKAGEGPDSYPRADKLADWRKKELALRQREAEGWTRDGRGNWKEPAKAEAAADVVELVAAGGTCDESEAYLGIDREEVTG